MAAPLSSTETGQAPDVSVGPANILLVDDEPKNLLALEAVLESLGQNLVKAGSGKEALRCLMRQDFAVILLDVQMPEMDGFETAALIRARDRNRHTPIIFLTAVGKSEQEVFRGYEAGAVDYLLKPFEPEILRFKISVLVDLHRKTEEVRRLHAELQRHVHGLEEGNRLLRDEVEIRRRAEEGLRLSEERLGRLNAELEARVRARTADLERSNQELAQYAAIASHDLQEPLRTMSTYLQLLERDLDPRLDPGQRQTLEVVLDSCRRLHRMIGDVLSFSQVGQGRLKLEPVDCGSLVRGILAQLGDLISASRAQVTVGALPTVEAEPGLLSQVFQNLIGNALKFQRGQPRVDLGAERVPEGWRFWVRDNGIGIDAAHFDKLFKLFRRLHSREEFPGSGLGLSICKKIVDLHGGRIWVESSPDKGATFCFTLPDKGGRGA